MKNLISYLAAAALLTSPALFAQTAEQQSAAGQQAELAQQDQQNTPNTSPNTPNTPPQTTPAPSEQGGSSQSEGTNNLNEPTGQAPEQSSTVAGQKFIEKPSDQQILASDLMGYSVTNLQNQNVGQVEDLILDQNDRPVGIVISAGGFLGLGAKHVAIPMSEARIDRENKIVRVDISKEELNKAPAFKAQKSTSNGQKEEGSGESNGSNGSGGTSGQ